MKAEQGRAGGGALVAPGLLVEAADRVEPLALAELRLGERRLQDLGGLVVDGGRHRIGVAVLAAMGEREAGRISEAAGRPVHDLGNER